MKEATKTFAKESLKDETGKNSMGRVLLIVNLFGVYFAGGLEALTPVEFPGEWWALQATIFIGLLAWVAGPRGLQYLGPQIGDTMAGLKAAISKRKQGVDSRTDDER